MAVKRAAVPTDAVQISRARREAGMKRSAVNIGGGSILYTKQDGSVIVRSASAPGAGGEQAAKVKQAKGEGVAGIKKAFGELNAKTEATGGKGSKRCYRKKSGDVICYTVKKGRKVK